MPIKLGVLGSTRGTDMLALIDAIANNQLNAMIKLVISNKKDAMILERARAHQLAAQFIDPLNLTREAYDEKLSAALHTAQIDLIVLIGFMRILSATFIHEWRDKIINVHPSLLPKYAGGMDNTIHQQVLMNGEKETGCTVHYVTEKVDSGPILIQKKCPVLVDDTVDTLKDRVQRLEGEALIAAIQQIGNTK